VSSKHFSERPKPVGFSLIEVVLSLGILSFAFVGLMGLIPTGLSSLDTAIDSTVESQILQHISALCRQSTYTALKKNLLDINPGADPLNPNRPMPDYFFNEQGEELKGDQATQQASYVYAAAVICQAGTPVPVGAQSGTTAGTNSYNEVATVRVLITKRSAPSKIRAYSLFVANNGLAAQ